MLLMRFVQPLFVLAVHASAVSVTFVVVDTLGNVVPEAEVTVRSNVRNTVEAGRVRSIEPPRHWVLIGLGALYGLTDEFHQIFVRGRSPDWTDWVADVIGVLCGYLLVIGLSTSSDHGVDASR